MTTRLTPGIILQYHSIQRKFFSDITKRISDSQPVTVFIKTASKYCLLLENMDKRKPLHILQEAYFLLPQLCLSAMRLPDIKRTSNYSTSRISDENWQTMFNSLREYFSNYDQYQGICDPYDRSDTEVMKMSLSDDLCEIFENIKPGLDEWEKVTTTEKRDIIWEWKFSYENHWGDHATRTFRALYHLLNQHIEDERGDYIGTRGLLSTD